MKKNLVLPLLALVAPAVLIYQSCGISKPRYIDYTEDGTDSSTGTTTGATTGTTGTTGGETGGTTGSALDAFTTNVEPAIDKSNGCGQSFCHAAGSGGLTMKPNEADANRTALKSFSTDAQTIFDKISSSSHGGGDQSGNLSLAALQAWTAAESAGGSGASADLKECPPVNIFRTNVQPAIDSVCAGCHTNGDGGLTLEASDENADANRANLYDFSDNPNDLFEKISQANGKSHGGGNRSNDLPLANIQTWYNAESDCQ